MPILPYEKGREEKGPPIEQSYLPYLTFGDKVVSFSYIYSVSLSIKTLFA